MSREELNRRFGVTDAELDEWARPFEDGTWDGVVTDVRMGRPKLFDEDMQTVSFRLPLSRQEAVEAACKERGMSKSEFFRQAIDRFLAEQ